MFSVTAWNCNVLKTIKRTPFVLYWFEQKHFFKPDVDWRVEVSE